MRFSFSLFVVCFPSSPIGGGTEIIELSTVEYEPTRDVITETR